MMKQCVVHNGDVINIGPWDYQMQPFMVSPPVLDDEGNIVTEAEYEDRPTNPLPDGAEVVELEVYQDADGAWRAVGHEPPLDNATMLALALADLAEAQEADKTEIQLALAELAEIITGGDA